MGRKCGVDGCLSDSTRPEDTGVTFHKVPMHNDIRPKWISLCHIPEDKRNTKIIYVCSRHFLRADFCNFKGKKYMLRQGVLPSVFPWDKSKLEAIKAEVGIKKEEIEPVSPIEPKKEPEDETIKLEKEIKTEVDFQPIDNIKEEELHHVEADIKLEVPENTVENNFEKDKTVETSSGSINFAINSKIEALDFNNVWYPARIVEVDYEENEVLIHFEKFSSKYDEWICMDSARLRPVQQIKNSSVEQYTVGERCLATWSDFRKFPATVTKVIGNDMYEVLFDDGFVKNLRGHRMCKAQGRPVQSSPLFDPVKGTKQDRRDKKRKLNVADLFRKRPRMESTDEKQKPTPASPQVSEPVKPEPVMTDVDYQSWMPQWENGKPIGEDSTIDTNDGTRKSVVVADPRLPKGWTKHLIQRTYGASAGKWDTIILSPDQRRFRTRSEIRTYIENHPDLNLSEIMFDFSLHRKRRFTDNSKKVATTVEATPPPPASVDEQPHTEETILKDDDNANSLKILHVDDSYKCPIEGCGKNFRRENLAQMHVKHYHPEYTKFLDSTPNVADLAYARTVGENLDKSPGPVRPPTVRQSIKTVTPKAAKLPQSPLVETETKPQSPTPSAKKDSEIIKLLSTKPFDKETESIQPLPSGLPSNMYPDIKLKDLLNKSEAMPKRDDINLKSLCTTRPPVGIKTLLPVVRPTETQNEEQAKQGLKRKRGPLEQTKVIKGKEIQPTSATQPLSPHELLPLQPTLPPNNIIIEGGEVIKIVRMKQEEIINCTCGFTEEDGLMIQCELCLCWQHAYCNNIEKESQVPEKYVCYICQNPVRERASRKYFHDQDWLKQGTLPTGSYHSKDEQLLQKRFEKLKKAHDISGGLLELRDYVHSLSVKLKIAEVKNHPKLYLWSKPWEKLPLPEKMRPEFVQVDKPILDGDEQQYIKNEDDLCKTENQNDSMLMMILKSGKEEIPNLNSLMDNSINQLSTPIIPRPEAAIDSADCRLNLLEHIAHSESLVDERLDDFEKEIDALEEGLQFEESEDYPRTRQTLQMLLRDLEMLKEFGQLTTI